MTPEQLAELEMHLAAGTDLPTALAAIGEDRPPGRRSRAFQVGVLVGAVAAILYFWLCA